VDCVGEFERYSLKTMKKDLLKRLSPRPARIGKQHEDAAPNQSGSSIVTPAGLPWPIVLRKDFEDACERYVPFYAAGSQTQPTDACPPSGASPMESRRLADTNHAASVPLRGKPFAINGSSG